VDRGKITFGQASIRNLLRIVDFFVIGEVMIASDDKRQRLGDKAAKTVVVRNPKNEKRHYSTGPAVAAPVAGGAPAESASGEPPFSQPVGNADAGGRGRLPAIGWDLSNTIWGLIGGLLLALLIPIVVLPFDPDLDSDAALLAAQALFGGALIVVAVGVASRWKFSPLGAALEELGLRSAPLKAFGIALLMLLVYYVGVGIFASLVAQPDQEDVARELGVSDPNLLVAISAVALIAVLAPFSEELFFRGLVFSGLRSRLSLWPAAVISGLIFGLPHVFTGPVAAIPLSALGVGLAWLYDRTGSLWPCIFAHMVNNGLALAVTS
jgi:membrane protease YdiL (CAAX protease family)